MNKPAPALSPHSAPKPLSADDRNGIRQRFYGVNRERLRQMEYALSPRQRTFLDLLPFLFHTNHPMMPGFVSKDTAAGISGYAPNKRTLTSAAKLARSFDYKKRIPRQYGIEALLLIGSAGTIAYSKQSDFDVWLCHRSDLGVESRANLAEKGERISAWAETLGLEVHFFLMAANDVREGRQIALSRESSGSAQRHLLLDEFYRTALLIAGRYPLWWLVPPDREGDYASYAGMLLKKRFVPETEVIDFGGLPEIPANEFFGASLWQLYKAISSPHKALLKILLLEAYASEYPGTELLSHRYKRLVFEGEIKPDNLDPYLLMMKKVEDYLIRHDDMERLELARRSFYLKAGQRLTESVRDGDADPLRERMATLVKHWGWDEAHLRALDSYRHWKIERALEERSLVVLALMRSYQSLSAFARGQRELAAISKKDMNILGRQLFAAFERKAGKIELVTRGVSQDLSEPQLVVQRTSEGGQEGWRLYRDLAAVRREALAVVQPLKRARTLVELLVWCHFNGLARPGSHVVMEPAGQERLTREAAAILDALQKAYPNGSVARPSLEALSRASHPVAASIFVNVGVDPFADFTRQGKHLTSDRFDPLNYSSRQQNLAISFDYLYVTSWGEVFTFHYAGVDGLAACLSNYMGAALGNDGRLPIGAHCFLANRGGSISQRIQQLFLDVPARIADSAYPAASRYILKAENRFYCFFFSDGAPSYRLLGGYQELLDYLARPNPQPSPVLFDRFTLHDSPLAFIAPRTGAASVDLYYFIQDHGAQVFIMDEKGSLFVDEVPFHDEPSLLAQYNRFLEAVRYRQDTAGAAPGLIFRKLERQRRGGYMIKQIDPGKLPATASYLQLQVISERVGEKTEFTLYCDGREFSTLEHGADLFAQVARHILGMRHGVSSYPIYITDIDLSGLVTQASGDQNGLQTIHYLRNKKIIEQRLNKALAR